MIRFRHYVSILFGAVFLIAGMTACSDDKLPVPTGMVLVEGGSFDMGDTFGEGPSAEQPGYRVTLASFYIGKFELTVGEFRQFVQAIDYRTDAEKSGGGYVYDGSSWVIKADASWKNPSFTQTDKSPVVLVSWHDATEYCNYLSGQEGLTLCYTNNGMKCDFSANGYRLPMEVEWEFAARERGKKVRFGNGKDTADPAEMNFDGSAKYKQPYSVVGVYRGQTLPVGSFAPNALGLHDMAGNVGEWCWDWFDSGNYANSPPSGPRGSGVRVLRGGAWYTYPKDACASYRGNDSYVDLRDNYGGFRLARRFEGQ